MTYKKGEVSNPRGRGSPAYVDGRLRCRASVLAREGTEENIALLEEIRDDPGASFALRAQVCFCLLDRGWGRPLQARSLHFEDDNDAERPSMTRNHQNDNATKTTT